MTEATGHGAAGPALGYLFQTKLALLHLLRSDREVPGRGLSLELFDDVAWDQDGAPIELVQAKHTVKQGSGLGDAAAEWWSALSVWLDAGPVAAADAPRLVLVTNASASTGSALYSLRPGSRDEVEADRLLLAAAIESEAKATERTRAKVVKLTAADRRALLARITVLDRGPDVSTVDADVAALLRITTPPGHEQAFLDQVWGRWWDVAVRLLRREIRTVTGEQWRVVVNAVRDGFTSGRLPTTVPEFTDEREDELAEGLGDRLFVHQLRWVGAPTPVLRRCIVDYYRSTEQQREWAEDSLVGLQELEGFQSRLKKEWQLAFGFATQRLPSDADDKDRERAGLGLLQAMLDQTAVVLRDAYREPFLGRGALHELADRSAVGWHPDFVARLRALLLDAS